MKQGISRRTLYLRRWCIVPDRPAEDSRMIDVTAVSDRVTAGDLRKHLRTEQTVGVRQDRGSFFHGYPSLPDTVSPVQLLMPPNSTIFV